MPAPVTIDLGTAHSAAPDSMVGGVSYTYGTTITPNKDITITALRAYIYYTSQWNGLYITIYRVSDQAVVVEAYTSTYTSNAWNEIACASTVLQAGVAYKICAYSPGYSNPVGYKGGANSAHAHSSGSMTLTSDWNVDGYNGGKTFPTAPGTGELYLGVYGTPANVAPNAPGVPSVSPNPVNTVGTITFTNGTDPDGDAVTHDVELSTNNGTSWAVIKTGVQSGTTYDFTNEPATTTAKLRVRTKDSSGAYSGYATMAGNFTILHNVAPNAPTLTGPANNATVDRAITQRFSWTFSDPNAGDSQSKFDLRYRIGAGAWTTITQVTPNNFYDFAPAALAAGTYEWQVLTYDSQGVAGPWSASSFVTMANAPSSPTITTPASGAIIGTQAGTAVWSAPTQESYQLRKVADSAGSPDTNTVYYDTGEVVSATARDAALSYPVNNRYEHVQVRIRVSGLWSSWSSVRVQVSYTPPPVAPVVLSPDPANGRVQVAITNPAGSPAVTSNEIWRKEVGPFGGGVKRIAIVAPNAIYNDYSAPGNTTLEYYVVAKAGNGTSTQSATYTTSLALRGIWLGDPTDWTTLHQFRWDGEGRGVLFEPEVALNQYVGRKFQVAEFGTTAKESVRMPLPLDNETGDREAFQKLIRRTAVLLYRDGRGRKMYCVLQSENMADTTYGGKVDFAAYAVDYDEAV